MISYTHKYLRNNCVRLSFDTIFEWRKRNWISRAIHATRLILYILNPRMYNTYLHRIAPHWMPRRWKTKTNIHIERQVSPVESIAWYFTVFSFVSSFFRFASISLFSQSFWLARAYMHYKYDDKFIWFFVCLLYVFQ